MRLFLAMETQQALLYLAGGAILTTAIFAYVIRRNRKRDRSTAKSIIQQAELEAATICQEARLKAVEQVNQLRREQEQLLQARAQQLADSESRLLQKETLINQQWERLHREESCLDSRWDELEKARGELDRQMAELASSTQCYLSKLEAAARLSQEEARKQLLLQMEVRARHEAVELSRRIVEEAKNQAEEKARRIISLAIQRYASNHAYETTTATIQLPNEEIKGRIIGREGRNIRAFESATGVTVLIDDTPGAVVLSGFDPVRREIARESMQRLILDGRIHPTRIDEVVAKVSEETEDIILKAGEEAVARAGVPSPSLEVLKTLGRLRFRLSFNQNILDHSVEVAQFAGLMAAELGLDILAAKRAGLFHDIGKAVDQEIEGAHAVVGAEILKRNGESEIIVNAVASHHNEVEPLTCYGVLVSAADAISASRPGARSESMTTYLKRVTDLEQLGMSFHGVEKCFAVQAGRELRVLVNPDDVDDDGAYVLARNIAKRIEDELQYPGQIRITVMRETRCVEFAK